MTAVRMDGTAHAEELRRAIDDELRILRLSEVNPGLGTVLVGDDPGARAYERHVRSLAEGLDYHYVCDRLAADVPVPDVLATIGKLNADPRVTGILVLRPLPPHVDEHVVDSALEPAKDIEAVHPENTGLLAQGRPRFLPSTPASCFSLLDAHVGSLGADPADWYSGKTVVVVGRSNSVGLPAQWLALRRNATVVQAHSHTAKAGRLGDCTRLGDVLIVAAGVRGLVTGDMVREGALVVDVGFHMVDGKIMGDVDAESASERASAISPVPGGVGPVTDVWLIGNAMLAAGMVAHVEPRFGRATADPSLGATSRRPDPSPGAAAAPSPGAAAAPSPGAAAAQSPGAHAS